MAKIFKNDGYEFDLFGEKVDELQKKSILQQNFLVPPFSTFDIRQGYWQDRKRQWIGLGIKSELGRDAQTFHMKDWVDKKGESGELSGNKLPSDTSIFDPVVCELCYKWFNIENGKIFDPFSGGSVRGIVASLLGYNYTGIDLSSLQIEANKQNANEVIGEGYINSINWINDDSLNVDNYIDDESVDMIFTCPPYYDLEIYSDKENDLSNMSFENFKIAYTNILKKSFKKLKNNRFGIIVIGDVRDKKGFYRNLVDITKSAICNDNIGFYNDIVLLNSLASASLRAKGQFVASRKVVKVHQNILVFYKGDTKKIKENYKDMEFDY